MYVPNTALLCACILYSRSFFYLFGIANNYSTRGVCVRDDRDVRESYIRVSIHLLYGILKGKK